MRYWILCVPLALAAILLAGCGGPYALYWDLPSVQISCDDTSVSLRVPDPDDDGWAAGTGWGDEEVELTLKETAGKKAYIEESTWTVWTEDGDPVVTQTDAIIPVKELEGGGEITLDVVVGLYENQAFLLDEDTGASDDEHGEGTIRIEFGGYDDRADHWQSAPIYLDFEVDKD